MNWHRVSDSGPNCISKLNLIRYATIGRDGCNGCSRLQMDSPDSIWTPQGEFGHPTLHLFAPDFNYGSGLHLDTPGSIWMLQVRSGRRPLRYSRLHLDAPGSFEGSELHLLAPGFVEHSRLHLDTPGSIWTHAPSVRPRLHLDISGSI